MTGAQDLFDVAVGFFSQGLHLLSTILSVRRVILLEYVAGFTLGRIVQRIAKLLVSDLDISRLSPT